MRLHNGSAKSASVRPYGLGAQPKDVLQLVLRNGIRLTALRILLALVAALWSMRWLSSLLFETRPLNRATFSAVSLRLLAVAFVVCWLPARRAARIDPTQALREQ